MNRLSTIKIPIQEEITRFEKKFSSAFKSNVPLLDIITRYILKRKGKQMRPILVFLSAKLTGTINSSTFTAASLIEMLHTATLIHDDVVDESYSRRGFFSINALWKSKAAVLTGDYLLAKGLLLTIEEGEHELLGIVSEAVKEMSEGELLQIQQSRKLNIKENDYFEIITKKTATLIAACTACGARSVNATPAEVNNLKNFGKNIGIAFQIKDDLLDFQYNSKTGKPKGNDLKEKKLTLPLIHSFQTCSKLEKKKIIKLINEKKITNDALIEISSFVEKNGGIQYANQKMQEYKNAAIELIKDYPSSPVKTSLIDFIHYVTDRNK